MLFNILNKINAIKGLIKITGLICKYYFSFILDKLHKLIKREFIILKYLIYA
jgi:hypothetical protein